MLKLQILDPIEILPCDGSAIYYGAILDPSLAEHYFREFEENIEWKNDEAFLFGKHFITERQAAWYADKPYTYTYSNKTKIALPWTDALLEVKALIEKETGASYNSCLMNRYPSGKDGMAWHSDDEKTLKNEASIASLSLGVSRRFGFKHKLKGKTIYLELEPGSLLEMKGSIQSNWLHRLPPTKKVHLPRINLTFRTIEGQVDLPNF